jgi:hemolysin D
MVPAKKIVVPFPRQPLRRSEHELAFLPAALEIAETPPSPIGRAVGATIIALFCVAIAWASLGSVDVVATAPGKLIPSGRTKLIQPFETGVVRAIHVHDGQHVNAGERLIELDPTMSEAELDHLKGDLIAVRLDVARLRAALAGHADPLVDFHPPEDATPVQIEMHRQFLMSQILEQNAKIIEIERQQSQKEAERATVAASITKLEATIPVLQQRVDVRKYLVDKDLGSKLTYLTEYQDLVAQQQDLIVEQSKLKEADTAIAGFRESREKAAAEYRRALYDELAKADGKAAGIAQDVIKAERRTKLQELLAPVDGVVQQLAVHTVGGVVTPAQVLAVIVPLDSRLEIEATLSNNDIGFVHAGQGAEIKVDTFNFTRYGLLHGQVLSVSPDAIPSETTQERANGETSATTPQPATNETRRQELVYAARVSLDQQQLKVDGRLVELGPGMAVTVEVKTGSRRIISYLLSPLVKYKHDVLRER